VDNSSTAGQRLRKIQFEKICNMTLKIRGVASSLKLGEQKNGQLWPAREREPITGVCEQSSSGGPGGIALGRGSGNDFGTKAHISCAVLMLVVVVDLTETTRQRHTFNTAAI